MAPAMEMSESSIEEYTLKMQARYARRRSKQARSRLLDEYVAVTGRERKHANKVLLGHKRNPSTKKRRGAPRRYGEELVSELRRCWLAMDQPCGKRMKDMLPLWIEHIEYSAGVREQLKQVSAASIDRHLASFKVTASKKARPPKPASAVKRLIDVRAESWDVSEPGWTEVDTVAHCGGDMSGSFIWTLTSVDVFSGWTELRATWNRGQHACCEALESIWSSQPFKLLGVDSDNGGEFLNHHLHQRLKGHGIKQTRSRPYFKNDQAYVEQKNYTHVRELLGYERFEHQELIEGLNELLTNWSLWKNLFCVTMQQVSKERVGSKQIRKHAKQSRTPAQRLLDGSTLTPREEERLRDLLEAHNPFEMRERIRQLEDKFWETRNNLYLGDEEALVVEGRTPLRSDRPSTTTKERTTHKVASVSQL
ncbi:integrase catalytic domain-containing protein [Sulfuriroseicoccus oceanibius]|uniref:Transposase family protein n=1 Tax=Sulfuriroseicoccus oceanibius TaxID=2707525 RepID=A0A6B3L8M5_9BACT|nr:DDE-type integrase/transposase/recombinase [Sulfuriroseicoccus oceanibius]QQL45738.1 transposase family protein [Sulfuriroseicoccus oceanibius]